MTLTQLTEDGDKCRALKHFRAAIVPYRMALALEPDHAPALLGLADAYRGLKEPHKVIEVLEHYLRTGGKDGAARTRLADAYRKTGQAALAEEHYRSSLALKPRNRSALMGLGDLCHQAHRDREALACWEPLLQIDPGLLNILTMAGHTHRKLLAFDKAVDCFGKALALAPSNPYALFGMADSLRGLGRFDQAAPYWEAILEADPGNQQVLARAGDCFFRLGMQAKAEALFNRSLAISYDKNALLGLGRVYRQRSAFEAELRCYEKILTRNPADTRTARLRAEALEAMKG